MFAIATFEENSVKVLATRLVTKTTANGGRALNPFRYSAIYSDIPVSLEPSAMAKPPPKRNKSPQGIFCCTTFQVKRDGDGFLGRRCSENKNYSFECIFTTNNKKKLTIFTERV